MTKRQRWCLVIFIFCMGLANLLATLPVLEGQTGSAILLLLLIAAISGILVTEEK